MQILLKADRGQVCFLPSSVPAWLLTDKITSAVCSSSTPPCVSKSTWCLGGWFSHLADHNRYIPTFPAGWYSATKSNTKLVFFAPLNIFFYIHCLPLHSQLTVDSLLVFTCVNMFCQTYRLKQKGAEEILSKAAVCLTSYSREKLNPTPVSSRVLLLTLASHPSAAACAHSHTA